MSAYEDEFDGAIGIDLGTTYSCVAVFRNDRAEVIPNDQGNRTTPSCVAFYHDDVLVGDSAKNLAARGVPYVLFDAKRMIGARYDDATLQSDMKHWPFTVRRGKHDRAEVEVQFRDDTVYLAPEQISAKVLTYLKECAEKYLGQRVTKAVVTVPAYFNDSQRQATKDAGMIAGLDVLRILNEPTAAALCYGLGVMPVSQASGTETSGAHGAKSDHTASAAGGARNIVVFDFGGGTFDVTVVTVDSGTFAVRATAGDTHLGGQDIDANLLRHLAEDVQQRHGVCLMANRRWLAKARAACERVKRTLSFAMSDELTLEGILPNEEDYTLTVSRATLETLNEPVLERCRAVVQRALGDAGVRADETDAVILVGGSSRIPRVQTMLSELFTARRLSNSVHPDEAVAIGAAIQASILHAGGNTGEEHRAELATADAQAATEGAAAAAHSRSAGILLMDVLPLSIGVEIDDGKFDVIIPRNTTIPYKATKEYSTVEDNQRDVDIAVYEGERPRTRHNHKLGAFSLEGIAPAPKGQPTIRVTFSVDADGVLTITAAEEHLGGMSKTLVVQNEERLSAAEVAAMVATAERFARRDGARAERREKRASRHDDDDDDEEEEEDADEEDAEAVGRKRRTRRAAATTTTSTKKRKRSDATCPTPYSKADADVPCASTSVTRSARAGEGTDLSEAHAHASQELQRLLQRLEKALQQQQQQQQQSSESAETTVHIPPDARQACSKLLRNGQEWVTHRLTTYTNTEELGRKVHKIQKRLHRAIRVAEGGSGQTGDGSENENDEASRDEAMADRSTAQDTESMLTKVCAKTEDARDREGRSSGSECEGNNSNHEAAATGMTTLCQTDMDLH